MTHPNKKVNSTHLTVVFAVEAATVAAYTMILVKKPVRFVRDSILAKISWLLRYIAEKQARGVYYLLSSIVNNRLTRHISPSVSDLDSKIENVCSTSGKFIGNVLASPGILAFYLVAASYSTAISLLGALVYTAWEMLEHIMGIFNLTVGQVFQKAFLDTKRDAARYKNVVSKAAYMALQASWILPSYTLILPVIALPICALYRAFSFAFMSLFTPVYMLSSVLRLDNRFNIYDYASGIGAVHGYIQDILANLHDEKCPLSSYVRNGLIAEAITGDLDTTPITSTAQTPPAKLEATDVKQGAPHQHAAFA